MFYAHYSIICSSRNDAINCYIFIKVHFNHDDANYICRMDNKENTAKLNISI